jgi:hypothetical protein
MRRKGRTLDQYSRHERSGRLAAIKSLTPRKARKMDARAVTSVGLLKAGDPGYGSCQLWLVAARK